MPSNALEMLHHSPADAYLPKHVANPYAYLTLGW